MAFRAAVRSVIRNCIYGVDINPLAVELCKVGMWLEAHNPNEPLNFLDHRIKCGNAIVGLAHKDELENGIAMEAFKRLPEDDKDIVAKFRKLNKEEINGRNQRSFDFEKSVGRNLKTALERLNKVLAMPEHTPEEIAAKQKAYHKLQHSRELYDLHIIADIQVAQFFIPKTKENALKIITDEQYWRHLRGELPLQGQAVAMAMAVARGKRFFHWFLEFPQVLADGGFDCILGNPPFLGGSRIGRNSGNNFLNLIKYCFHPISGQSDLVAYFFRRDFIMLRYGGFLGLIATNSISQGRTREGALDVIVSDNGIINFALSSIRWPGVATVQVSVLTIRRGKWDSICYLNNKPVKYISSNLDDESQMQFPFKLVQNAHRCFTGSKVYGEGFVISREVAHKLIEMNSSNSRVLSEYFTGNDICTSPTLSTERCVINFLNWEEKTAKKYAECYQIILDSVKPKREKLKKGDRARQYWWQYERPRFELYDAIRGFENALVMAKTTKFIMPTFVPNKYVFADKCIVFAFRFFLHFSILQSCFHDNWAWKLVTTMGGTGLQYATQSCFETFPFPQNLPPTTKIEMERIGEDYHEFRRQLMLKMQLGLTKTYNQFHNPDLREFSEDDISKIPTLTTKESQNQYGKNTVTLWKHLDKTEGTCRFNEAVHDILHLRELHKQMDETVLRAYGWHEETKYGSGINLAHDFYEVDYLPENDRVRYTISPEARKEVLKRLLLLNHEIYEDEVLRGLHDKKKAKRGKGGKKSTDSMQIKMDI